MRILLMLMLLALALVIIGRPGLTTWMSRNDGHWQIRLRVLADLLLGPEPFALLCGKCAKAVGESQTVVVSRGNIGVHLVHSKRFDDLASLQLLWRRTTLPRERICKPLPVPSVVSGGC